MGDIIQLKVPERYAQEGLLAPIDEDFDDLLECVYTYNDEIYGIGALGSTCGILYNRDIFDLYHLSEPENYQDFLNICDVLKTRGVTPVGVAGQELWHMEFWVNHFFRTDILSEDDQWLMHRQDGEVSWTDDAPMAMLTHLQQLFMQGFVNADWPTKQDSNLAYSMAQGEVSMMYTGSWTAREIQKLNPDMNLGWFYLPDEDGNVVIPQNQDVYWCVTRDCGEDQQKYAAAMCFLNFFYDDTVYGALCEETYGFPVTNVKADFDETGIQQEIKTAFCASDQHVIAYIGNEDTPQGFEKELLYIVQDMADGKIEPEQAAKQLDSLWDEFQAQEK